MENFVTNPVPIADRPRVAIVGAGVVGLSWTGLFLANGLSVTICDPRPDVKIWVLSGLEGIRRTLHELGYPFEKIKGRVFFEEKLHNAVAAADVIQESIPEVLEAKQMLYEKLERFCQRSSLILSSSGSFSASLITKKMKCADNVIVGHPFDCPHLLPLVELAPGARTSRSTVERAISFYRKMGRQPVLVDREVEGLVANRLYRALVLEGIHLVQSGVISVDRLDQIVSASLGPCWAAAGPFKALALSLGLNNIENCFDNLRLDGDAVTKVRRQSVSYYSYVPMEDLQKEWIDRQIAILKMSDHSQAFRSL